MEVATAEAATLTTVFPRRSAESRRPGLARRETARAPAPVCRSLLCCVGSRLR